MSSLVSVVFNLELSLIIGVITSFVLGSLLLLIKAPNTEYSRKIGKTKNTIAICFYICSILFYVCLRYSGVGDYEIFSSMMMFLREMLLPMVQLIMVNLHYVSSCQPQCGEFLCDGDGVSANGPSVGDLARNIITSLSSLSGHLLPKKSNVQRHLKRPLALICI